MFRSTCGERCDGDHPDDDGAAGDDRQCGVDPRQVGAVPFAIRETSRAGRHGHLPGLVPPAASRPAGCRCRSSSMGRWIRPGTPVIGVERRAVLVHRGPKGRLTRDEKCPWHTPERRAIAFNRRRFFRDGSWLHPDAGALVIAAQDADTVTLAMIEAAQKIAGVSFTPAEQQAILTRLNAAAGYLAGFAALRAANLRDDEQPAIVFNPVPAGTVLPSGARGLIRRAPDVARPSTDEALAFLPVTHLARLVETRQVKPSELTELYLSRLAKYAPILHCVVSLTSELARAQARQADEEIGRLYRGPLHGIRLASGSVRGSRDQNHVVPRRGKTGSSTPMPRSTPSCGTRARSWLPSCRLEPSR